MLLFSLIIKVMNLNEFMKIYFLKKILKILKKYFKKHNKKKYILRFSRTTLGATLGSSPSSALSY